MIDSISNAIDRLLVANCEPMNEDSPEAKQLGEDAKRLKVITGTVRSIVKQGAFLLGQQIHEAKEILRKHRNSERTFTEWMKITFTQGHRSAYNALELFQFHEEIEDPMLQNKLKEIPKRAAYLLASRDGDISRKIEILKNYSDQKADDLIILIDETLPLPDTDGRKKRDNDTTSIDTLRSILKKLQKRKGNLSGNSMSRISELRGIIDDILSGHFETEDISADESSNMEIADDCVVQSGNPV